MIKFVAYIVCYLIYPLSFLVPRSKKVWIFGSYRGAFNDNSKYMFLYAAEHYQQAQIAWISTSKETVNHVRKLGLPAYFVGSFRGVWLALRAGYWFVNDNTSDILFCLSGGTTIVNLWHGVPMKCIEFGITKGELAKRYVNHEFWDCFYHPASFIRPDWMVSTTDFFDEIFSTSFRIRKNQCMQVGCPRSRMLVLPKDDVRQFIERYESDYTKALLQRIAQYNKVFVYMPTWRDSQRECFANGFNLEAFNECLKQQNAYALMKPHANTIIDKHQKYSNIEFIDGNVDMYTILPFTDVLITDYSSVMYDYILMPEKKIILFHYDYEEYVQEREFIFPVDENVVGRRVYTFAELLSVMADSNFEVDAAERERIMAKFWGNTMTKDVCYEIFKHLSLCGA